MHRAGPLGGRQSVRKLPCDLLHDPRREPPAADEQLSESRPRHIPADQHDLPAGAVERPRPDDRRMGKVPERRHSSREPLERFGREQARLENLGDAQLAPVAGAGEKGLAQSPAAKPLDEHTGPDGDLLGARRFEELRLKGREPADLNERVEPDRIERGQIARQASALQQLLSEAEMGELFKAAAFGRGLPDDAIGFAHSDRRAVLER